MSHTRSLSVEGKRETGPILRRHNPIDEAVLADLIASIGVEETEAQIEIFDLFFDSTPVLMANVSIAARSGAWDQVEADLHALKGSCELFGATHLTEQCKRLGKLLACGEATHAQEQVAEIQVEYHRVVESLKAKTPRRANPSRKNQGTAGLTLKHSADFAC